MKRNFPTRVIAIVGYAYTGSTLLSGIMTNIPDTLAYGEVHHIIASGLTCSACGASCPVLAEMDTFHRSEDPDLYLKVSIAASRLGYKMLVVSDKDISTVTKYMDKGDGDAVFIFKGPLSFVASYLRHKHETNKYTLPTLYSGYLGILQMTADYFRNVYVVQYEQLATAPETVTANMCDHLDFEYPDGLIKYPPENWHNIGGNTGAYWGNDGDRSIWLDKRWKKELTEKQIAEIRGESTYQNTLRKLQAQCPLPFYGVC